MHPGLPPSLRRVMAAARPRLQSRGFRSRIDGMLTIRRAQMEVLNRAILSGYIQRLASAFFERRPEKFGSSGLAGADSFVRNTLPLAAKYGVESERHVAMFLDFVLMYGAGFESRPDCAWALEILSDPSDPDGNTRVERLTARLEAYAAASKPPVGAG
jgi:hypothetical protein